MPASLWVPVCHGRSVAEKGTRSQQHTGRACAGRPCPEVGGLSGAGSAFRTDVSASPASALPGWDPLGDTVSGSQCVPGHSEGCISNLEQTAGKRRAGVLGPTQMTRCRSASLAPGSPVTSAALEQARLTDVHPVNVQWGQARRGLAGEHHGVPLLHFERLDFLFWEFGNIW